MNKIEYMPRCQARRWKNCVADVGNVNDFKIVSRWQILPPKGGIKPCHCQGKVYSQSPLGTADKKDNGKSAE
jgi:hypothetical protein